MTFSSSTSILFLSWLGIPITYIVNCAQTLHGEKGLFVCGTLCLLILCALTYKAVARKGKPTDPIVYVFILGTFASVVDLIIALENDGIIYGFMTQYLKDGEPYLKTAYGTMINYWDGVGHYAMYLMMLAAFSWNQPFREVGLYWSGSIGHSMVVLLLGAISGKYGVHTSILLNVPYIFVPFLSCARFLRERPRPEKINSKEAKIHHKAIWERPFAAFLVTALTAMLAVSIFRGLVVLGTDSPSDLLHWYRRAIEPYLDDPSNFPRVQMLVYLLYFCPFYVMAIYGLLHPGCEWMPDWTLIHGGAAAQAQVAHIGASLHRRTPYLLRVPGGHVAQLVFWGVNLTLLVIPQLLANYCNDDTRFYHQVKLDPPVRDHRTSISKSD